MQLQREEGMGSGGQTEVSMNAGEKTSLSNLACEACDEWVRKYQIGWHRRSFCSCPWKQLFFRDKGFFI